MPQFAPLFTFLASMAAAQAATTLDVLTPANIPFWLPFTEGEAPLSIVTGANGKSLKIKRSNAPLKNCGALVHFGREGLIAPYDARPPEVTLAKVGDTIGFRTSFSYTTAGATGIFDNVIRASLVNSANTRRHQTFTGVSANEFADDFGWTALMRMAGNKNAFWRRVPNYNDKFIPTSIRGSTLHAEWPAPIGRTIVKPNVKVEFIFSITRTGPESVKLYGFIDGFDFESEAVSVKDFTFDTLIFQASSESNKPDGEIMFHELFLMVP